METELITDDIGRAAELIRSGGLVAVPTETVYGLAADGLNEDAVRGIYEVKGRPEVKPLSLMVPGAEAMGAYCLEVPRQAAALARRFWPGPLTIVLRARRDLIPPVVLAGGDTVGLRCPDHPLTLELLRRCAAPLAAPSANPSGSPSPKTAEQVLDYFSGRIDAVIDGGECGVGTESTVVSLAEEPFRVLRRGALGEEEIAGCLAEAMTVIGVTGGTGTGKTTAMESLSALGALTIDCDEVYHGLTAASGELRRELEARFGQVYDGDALDRKKLGGLVFGDPEALLELNGITHRYVSAEVTRRLREHAMNGGTLAAIDAVALIESGAAEKCDRVFGILAPRDMRRARIMAREGIGGEYADARINAQKKDDYYIENCDAVLTNDGTKEEFAAKCLAAFTEVLKNG